MTAVVSWWLIVELLGLVGWAVGRRAFARFPDRGFAWSKPLGALLAGGALWLLTALGLTRNDLGGAWLATTLVAALAGRRALNDPRGSCAAVAAWWRRHRRLILVEEALFLVAFCGWTVVRAADPAITHTEQPMDFMMLSAVSVATSVPPGDLWLAGEPISYYYLGYWLLATIGRLAGVPPEISYNLGQAAWLGWLVCGAFGLGFHLTRPGSPRRSARRAVAGGALAAIGVAIAGNLHLPVELVRSAAGGAATPAAPWDDWWWWRASRVVADADADGRPLEVITEFPFFSYLLGDDHPHLLSMPFLTLVAALALAAARGANPRAPFRPGSGALAGQNLAALGLGAATVAALVPLNTWDLPAGAVLLLGGALAARTAPPPGFASTLRFVLAGGLALAAVCTILTLPYLVSAQSQVRGIRPNLLNPTSAGEMAVMFGAFLPGMLLALGDAARHWRRIAALALGLVSFAALVLAAGAARDGADRLPPAAAERWLADGSALLVVLVLLAATLSRIGGSPLETGSSPRWSRRPGRSEMGAPHLLALGLGLIAVAELVFLVDLFGTRMNTVFKFWYQAWLFLALAAAVGWARSRSRRPPARWLRAAALLLLGLTFLYPAAALRSKTAVPRWTLDGLAHLEESAPGLRAAARWLGEKTPVSTRILEAPGDSYQSEQSLVSATSGRATLLGWQGHEAQWRSGNDQRLAAARLEAAARIYGATDPVQLAAELERWRIDYVICGPRERELYGAGDLDHRLRQLMVPVFESGDLTILRRR